MQNIDKYKKMKHLHGYNGYHTRIQKRGGRGNITEYLQVICIEDGVIYREVKIKNKTNNG